MSISSIWSYLGPVGQLLLTASTGVAALAALYRSLTSQARRLAVLDLATRHVAFWDQILKLELASTANPDEQQQAMRRALDAAARIRLYANQDFQRISWGRQVDTSPSPRSRFHLRWPRRLTLIQKFEYVLWKFLFYYFLLLAIILFLEFVARLLHSPRGLEELARTMLAVVLLFAILLVARFYGTAAERLALPPKPAPPNIDRI